MPTADPGLGRASVAKADATVLRNVSDFGGRRVLSRPSSHAPTPQAQVSVPMGHLSALSQGEPMVGSPQPTEQVQDAAYLQGLQAGREAGFEAGLKEGRAAGHSAGMEQGLIEGREAGAQESLRLSAEAREAIAQRIDRLDQWLLELPRQLQRSLAQQLEEAEDDMVSLCHGVVCRILGEHAMAPAQIAAAVRRAIVECCGESGRQRAGQRLVAVHVNPDDLALLEGDAEFAGWCERQGIAGMALRADALIELGGCIVHGSQGSLDARLETQLRALHAALRQERATRADEPRFGPGEAAGEEARPNA
jgi:flagellar assembly protein FliH